MALTKAEIYEHVGRMIEHGFEQGHYGLDEAKHLIKTGKDYRINGTFSTQADRAEAMKRTLRGLWKLLKGVDPDIDADAEHYLQKHYVPSTGEDVGDDW